ncbi:phosphate ABC transporter permease PstA [Salinicoccus roseus]|jgi:phosphate transport system permease protein|uniref:Phosphate transport system permease protein PstA n=1 Tax=Salinicoccus roseus TaxID=45670 RepID=A0A0C2DPC2_9STAP|nr:phosphate ABC transporter permease PstA [Salinicoccus roseus]KIH71873.1 phosphate ABC transporter permease [Salinicoccus roseus]MDB0579006.1 phosphate ABC transporter permease PstA [Salinicoccus roseus]OZT78114.1 phosphate ABC transporter, permease protein PstA [Salinicoccus roseus]RPE54184.1 phosphate ABC transporter membrane protein 2 (PhoT family) [Salinicoccus roseus]GGA67605.1 phosphate transport system permease protein PstA [Salinicoccus roseus]
MELIDKKTIGKKLNGRLLLNKVLKYIFLLCTLVGLVVLATLLIDTIIDGWSYLTTDFFTNFSSSRPENAGIRGALIGTLWLMATTAPIAIILSVGTALYLEEYAPKNKLTDFIKINISNLAGVPSVVFGLLGLTLFVRMAGLGNSVLAAALTMSLMILPVIVVASQEAIRSVPSSIREASIGMGATKWQTITRIILPASLPGIITGIILALSRAIGETAPLVVIGIPTILLFTPTGVFDTFSALPMQIFSWVKMPNPEFQSITAAAILVLLFILFLMNSVAIYIRNKYSKRF